MASPPLTDAQIGAVVAGILILGALLAVACIFFIPPSAAPTPCVASLCGAAVADADFVNFADACEQNGGIVSAADATLEGYDATKNFCQCTCTVPIENVEDDKKLLMPDKTIRDLAETNQHSPTYFPEPRKSALTFACDDDGVCATGFPRCLARENGLPLGAYECTSAAD